MAQFGFVGPAYTAANPGQDNQELVNWFVEIDPNEPSPNAGDFNAAEAKTALGLLGVPGLLSLNTDYSGECRGTWVLPGRTQMLMVVGSQVLVLTSSARGSIAASVVGTLATSTGRVNIRDNGAGKIAVLVDGANLYTYNVTTGAFAQSFDPGFLGATTVCEMDGWFTFNRPGTQTFYVAPLYWDGVTPFNGAFFALKDNAPDNLVAVIENKRELWLLGEATTEPWYNAGGANFPFSRIEGGLMQIGCAAAQSVARTGKGLMWLARSERGENSVILTQGYEYTVVSSPAVSYDLNQHAIVSDALGYTYTEEGHEFYVLILPTGDVTWVYDLTTQLWHKRASFDTATALFHRQRVNCVANFGGMTVAGDFANGRIYWQTRSAYADDQYPLVALRRTAHVWDKADRNRVIHPRLQLDFFPGVGLVSGQGVDPQVMLRWSNDGGQSWGNEHWTGIGKIGETKDRAIFRRLGSARDRVYEVRISDPVKRDICGASLVAAGTAA